ncbi:MAG: hypothetical protein EBU88_06645 [Acidobacteria bacterium]|nr:hypothetical protein [Acidobacteriota bacterium]
MLDLRMIDVAIGIIFIYLLISVVCSAIRESIEALFNKRAAYLELAVRELLNDPNGNGLVKRFYHHPLITVLYPGNYEGRHGDALRRILSTGRNLPSYIPKASFALALLDLVARGEVKKSGTGEDPLPTLSIESIRRGLDQLDNPEVKRLVLIAIDSAEGQFERVAECIQTWFDTAMDGIASQYRRATNWIIFWIALFVTVSINVDTFRIADYLYSNGAVRQAIVARAAEVAKQSDPGGFQTARAELDQMQLPIGWLNGNGPVFSPDNTGRRLTSANLAKLVSFVPGWLVTTFAVTLGSLFWFDLLKKFMVIRTSIRPIDRDGSDRRSKT